MPHWHRGDSTSVTRWAYRNALSPILPHPIPLAISPASLSQALHLLSGPAATSSPMPPLPLSCPPPGRQPGGAWWPPGMSSYGIWCLPPCCELLGGEPPFQYAPARPRSLLLSC